MLSPDEAKHSKEKEIDPFPPSEDSSYSLEVHGDSRVDEQHESRQRDRRDGQEAERDVRGSEAHVRLQERHAGMQRAACRFERRMQALEAQNELHAWHSPRIHPVGVCCIQALDEQSSSLVDTTWRVLR